MRVGQQGGLVEGGQWRGLVEGGTARWSEGFWVVLMDRRYLGEDVWVVVFSVAVLRERSQPAHL